MAVSSRSLTGRAGPADRAGPAVASALAAVLLAASPAPAQDAAPTGAQQDQAGTIPRTGDPLPPPAPNSDEIRTLRQEYLDRDNAARVTPEDLARMRDRGRDTQGALAYPAYDGAPPPIGQRREIQVDPSPNAPPATIRLWKGLITAVTFVDRTGTPWPVARYARDPAMLAVNGAGCGAGADQPAASDASAADGERVTTLTMMPCSFWTWGSIVVSLDGYATPVILQVRSGDDGRTGNAQDTSPADGSHAAAAAAAVDMGLTIRLPGRSPLQPARPGAAAGAADAPGFRPDANLSAFLDGTPPKGARPARVRGAADAAAWILGGALYLRGSFTVVNPVHQARAGYGDLQVWRFDQPTGRILVRAPDGAEQILSLDF